MPRKMVPMPRRPLTRSLLPDSTLCGCRSCGEVFSGVRAFDDHRNQGRGRERACRWPFEIGLVLNRHRVWRYPLPEEERPAHWRGDGSKAGGGRHPHVEQAHGGSARRAAPACER